MECGANGGAGDSGTRADIGHESRIDHGIWLGKFVKCGQGFEVEAGRDARVANPLDGPSFPLERIIDSGGRSRQCSRMTTRSIAGTLTRGILGILQIVGALTCIYLECMVQHGVLPRLLPVLWLLGCGYGLSEIVGREPSRFAVTLRFLCAMASIGIFGYLTTTFTHGLMGLRLAQVGDSHKGTFSRR
jgi:hypothetical protein